MMKRLMRLRGSQHLRDLCAETEFNRAQLIQPFFVVEGLANEEPIAGLRGNVRHSVASALKQIEKISRTASRSFCSSPYPRKKRTATSHINLLAKRSLRFAGSSATVFACGSTRASARTRRTGIAR